VAACVGDTDGATCAEEFYGCGCEGAGRGVGC
jgi:hypothetical protein